MSQDYFNVNVLYRGYCVVLRGYEFYRRSSDLTSHDSEQRTNERSAREDKYRLLKRTSSSCIWILRKDLNPRHLSIFIHLRSTENSGHLKWDHWREWNRKRANLYENHFKFNETHTKSSLSQENAISCAKFYQIQLQWC